ncbi:MAG: hypothetical protein R2991_07695 [Thermoanaerobaculia bacterium]
MAEHFKYRIEKVPDLDQKRKGLDNVGLMFCFPTAAANWLYFIAHHGKQSAVLFGMPDMTLYGLVTSNIATMANYMNTDPVDGTGYGDAVDGLAALLDDRDIPAIVIGRRFDDDVAIQFSHLRDTVKADGLVSFCYGRYQWDGEQWDRLSGHCLSLVGLMRSDEKIVVDARPGRLERQPHDPIPPQGSIVLGRPQDGDLRREHTTLLQLFQGGDAGPTKRFLDSYFAIKPWFALTNVDKTLVHYFSMPWNGATQSLQVPLPFEGELQDLALHPTLPVAVCCESGGRDLWQLDLTDHTWRRRLTAGEPIDRLTYGGFRQRLFLAVRRTIIVLDGEAATERGRRELPFDVDALAFDEGSQDLLVVGSDAGRIFRLDRDLRLLDGEEIPSAPGRGNLRLVVTGPGSVVIGRERSDEVFTLSRGSAGRIRQVGHLRFEAGAATGLAAGAHGDRLHVALGGSLATIDLLGRVVPSSFDGRPVGPVLRVARSWHNFGIDPSWRG